ncbi:MAG: methyltransferase domain-containing protein [Deltaproteobacteria bacterium]|nr:methyltransferase domain-containing protein [Deltaproteobacteria bacterium]
MFSEEGTKSNLFDEWPDQYDRWFETPVGLLVKRYESELILGLLKPRPGEMILDVGCGTGVFTVDILSFGPLVVGLDISKPMLVRAVKKANKNKFRGVVGDMMTLPFADGSFDKVVSITALEFIENGKGAVVELFRVAKKGGVIVTATLNSLSPWASRRKHEADKGHSIFSRTIFRSPEDMRSIAPTEGEVKTAIHFQKDDDPLTIPKMECDGCKKGLFTGAFLAARWEKH